MAEQANINIGVNVGEGAKSLRTLKQEFKDIQKELDNVAVGTDEYRKKLKQLADVKDEIEDLNEAIASKTGAGKFQALANLGSSIAGGFAAAQGAMALFGSESENVQKALLKVQSAMALAQGLKELEGIGDAFSNLKGLVSDFGRSAVNAFKTMRGALIASGIGALVVALGTVVAYWDEISAAISGVSEEQQKLNEQTQANLDAEKGKLDAIGGQENILKLQGKSEKDILKLKMSQTDAVISATEAQIEQNDITSKAQIEAAKRNHDILKGILDFLTTPLRLILQNIDLVGKAIGKNFGLAEGFSNLLDKGASLLFDPEAEAKKAEATRQESLKGLEKLKNDRAGLELSIQAIDKAAADKAKESAKAKLESEAELQRKLKELRTDNIKDQEVQDLQRLKNQYEAEQESIRQSKASEETKSQTLLALREKYNNDWNAIETKYEEERQKKADEDAKKLAEEEKKKEDERIKQGLTLIDAQELEKKNRRELSLQDEIDFEIRRYDLLKSNKELSNADLQKLEEEHNAKMLELQNKQTEGEKAMQEALSYLRQNGLNDLQTITSLFIKDSDKAAKAQKAFALAQLAIDSGQAISTMIPAAFRNAKEASKAAPGPAAPIVYASVLAAGLASGFATVAANVAKAKALLNKAPGGGGGDVSVPGGGGGAGAPAMGQTVGNTTTNIENLQNQGTQAPQPLKAVVVQTEMANVNQQVNRIEERSKIN
jgi:hypothetical protein